MTTTRPIEVNNGITTTWVPLSTQSSIPAACSSAMYMVPGSSNIVAFDPWQGKNIPYALQCLPEEITQSWGQPAGAGATTLLGPFACPSAFSTASTVVDRIGTSIVCCPSQYDYTNSNCVSTLKSGSVVAQSIYAPSGVWLSWVDTTITSAGATITGVNAHGYAFGSSAPTSDGGSSSINTLSTVSKTSSSGSATLPTTTPSASSSTPSPAYSSGLSTGAKAGIGIAAAVIALAFVAGLVAAMLRHRRKKRHDPTVYHEKDGNRVPDNAIKERVPPHLGGHWTNPSTAVGGMHELDGNDATRGGIGP